MDLWGLTGFAFALCHVPSFWRQYYKCCREFPWAHQSNCSSSWRLRQCLGSRMCQSLELCFRLSHLFDLVWCSWLIWADSLYLLSFVYCASYSTSCLLHCICAANDPAWSFESLACLLLQFLLAATLETRWSFRARCWLLLSCFF